MYFSVSASSELCKWAICRCVVLHSLTETTRTLFSLCSQNVGCYIGTWSTPSLFLCGRVDVSAASSQWIWCQWCGKKTGGLPRCHLKWVGSSTSYVANIQCCSSHLQCLWRIVFVECTARSVQVVSWLPSIMSTVLVTVWGWFIRCRCWRYVLKQPHKRTPVGIMYHLPVIYEDWSWHNW